MNEAKKPANTEATKGLSRRKFLGYAGGLAGAALLFDACKKDDEPLIPSSGTIDLGQYDNGVLNLMFVIEQIEAAFFEQALITRYSGMTNEELLSFTDIRDHDIAHREYLRNYLRGNGSSVTPDLSGIDFNKRSSVLEHAELFKDLATGLYNEAARLFVSGEHVSMAIKMSSVEARHAAYISNVRSEGNFFGTVDVIGAEPGRLPSNVIAIINRFLSTQVSGSNLPNK